MLLLVAVLFACGDEYYGSSHDDNNSGPYPMEIEPSLSTGRDFIYYVSIDTAESLNTGIYKRPTGGTAREKVQILHGYNLHSPVIGFDDNTLAYLSSGRVMYHNISDKTDSASKVTDSFASIIYIRENLLLANRDSSLFFIDESDSLPQFVSYGWNPALVRRDTFVCITGEPQKYFITKNNIYGIIPETLFQMNIPAHVIWPSIETTGHRLAFTVDYLSSMYIYSAEAGQGLFTFLDSSLYPKALILDLNRIIFTGPDGRFYQSDFAGNSSTPF